MGRVWFCHRRELVYFGGGETFASKSLNVMQGYPELMKTNEQGHLPRYGFRPSSTSV